MRDSLAGSSGETRGSGASAARDQRAPVIFLWIAFAVNALGLIAIAADTVLAYDLIDSDDYMRLQEVRDWLAGQAWADVNQHRFVTEEGGAMHFSRLLDVPMAGIVLTLKPLFGARGAEIGMLFLYPLALLAAFYWVVCHLATLVGGRRAGFAAAVVIPFSYAALWQFVPGRIDHHNAQNLLLTCALYCAVRSIDHPKWAFWAAVSSVLMMTVGMETLPFVVTTALAVGIAWLITAQPRALLYFGTGLIGLSFTILLVAHAGGDPFKIYCDAYSPAYAMATLMSGVAAVALAALSPRFQTVGHRMAAAATVGAVALAIAFSLFPQCLSAGPYSLLDQETRDAWFLYGSAVRNVFKVVSDDGFFFAQAVYLIPIIASFVAIKLALDRRGHERLQMVCVALPVIAAALLALWQLRIAPFASALSIVPIAVMLGRIRERTQIGSIRSVMKAAALGLLIFPLPYNAVSWAAAVGKMQRTAGQDPMPNTMEMKELCLDPAHIGPLDGLPKGLVMNQFDMGPRILGLTGHSISSGFYHRNMQAALRSIRFFDGAVRKAPCELIGRNVDYVVHCPIGKRMGKFDPGEKSLTQILSAGDTPAWLEEIEIEDIAPLRVFRPILRPESLSACAAP